MQYAEFRAGFDPNQVAPAYVIHGDEYFFVREALAALRDGALKKSDRNMCCTEFDGSEVEPRALLDELRTMPFGGTRRVVILSSPGKFLADEDKLELLRRYLLKPTPSSCLVIVADSWDGRTAAAKLLARHSVLIECKPLQWRMVQAWLMDRARQAYGKALTADACQQLQDSLGSDLMALDANLNKLALYVGNRQRIEARDVEAVVGSDRARTVFELTDAVSAGNARQAMAVLQQLLLHGASVGYVVSMLAWQFRRLWLAKRLLSKRATPDQIGSALHISFPSLVDKLIQQARRMTEPALIANHDLLLKADIQSKTSTMSEELILECLITKLCGSGDRRQG